MAHFPRPLALLTLALCLLGSSTALAEPPATAGRGQLGGMLGGGISLGDDFGGLNPYGFGFGPRGGYTLKRAPVYLGAMFSFFVGERVAVDAFGFSNRTRAGYLLFAGEVGYDFGVGPVILRPTLMLGAAVLRARSCTETPTMPESCISDGDATALVGPGGSVLYAFKKIPLWLGAELRFLVAPGELDASTQNHVSALYLGAQIGALFGKR